MYQTIYDNKFETFTIKMLLLRHLEMLNILRHIQDVVDSSVSMQMLRAEKCIIQKQDGQTMFNEFVPKKYCSIHVTTCVHV